MRLPELISPGVRLLRGSGDTEISSVVVDSRKVTPGALFCALPGAQAVGVDFISQALSAGAAAVLVPENTDESLLSGSYPVLKAQNPRKAAALAAASFHRFPAAKLTLLGVTGTNGKTTVTYLLDDMLRTAGRRSALVGTVEIRYADVRLEASHTTPESVELQALLASMVEKRSELVSIEVSSHSLAQSRVAGLRFRAAAFTQLGRDHLDFHGDLESYFQSKALLFREHLAGDGVAIINSRDTWGRRLVKELRAAGIKVWRFEAEFEEGLEEGLGEGFGEGFERTSEENFEQASEGDSKGISEGNFEEDRKADPDDSHHENRQADGEEIPRASGKEIYREIRKEIHREIHWDIHQESEKESLKALQKQPEDEDSLFKEPAELRATQIRLSLSGFEAVFHTPKGSWKLRSPLVGAHNVENALSAAGLALAAGIPPSAVVESLSKSRGAPGRLERVEDPDGRRIFVDYAHTPDALERVLRGLRNLAPPGCRIITVFGCGGDRDAGKRAPMGQAAALYSDVVVVTSDNPRSEEPLNIIQMVVEGLRQAGLVESTAKQLKSGERGFLQLPDREHAIAAALQMAKSGDVVLIAGKGHEALQIVGREKRPFDDRQVARRLLQKLRHSDSGWAVKGDE